MKMKKGKIVCDVDREQKDLMEADGWKMATDAEIAAAEAGQDDEEEILEVTAAEVKAVIPQLNKDEDFTQQGAPKIAKVRAYFPGREVTAEVVAEAWAAYSAAN